LVNKVEENLSEEEFEELLNVSKDVICKAVERDTVRAVEEVIEKVRARYSDSAVGGIFLLREIRQLLQTALVAVINEAIFSAIDDLMDALAFEKEWLE